MLPADKVDHPGAYAIAAGCGALVGAMFFGTLNTWLSGVHAIGFSMAGGIAGAIASVELFKRMTGIKGSTGIAFAAPLLRHRGRRPPRLLLRRPRRFHLRHADQPALGRRFR